MDSVVDSRVLKPIDASTVNPDPSKLGISNPPKRRRKVRKKRRKQNGLQRAETEPVILEDATLGGLKRVNTEPILPIRKLELPDRTSIFSEVMPLTRALTEPSIHGKRKLPRRKRESAKSFASGDVPLKRILEEADSDMDNFSNNDLSQASKCEVKPTEYKGLRRADSAPINPKKKPGLVFVKNIRAGPIIKQLQKIIRDEEDGTGSWQKGKEIRLVQTLKGIYGITLKTSFHKALEKAGFDKQSPYFRI